MRLSFFRQKIAVFLALSLLVTAPVFAAEDVPDINTSSTQSYEDEGDHADTGEDDNDDASSGLKEEDGSDLPSAGDATQNEKKADDKADSGETQQSGDNKSEDDSDTDDSGSGDEESDEDEDEDSDDEDADSVENDDTEDEEGDTVSASSTPQRVALYRNAFSTLGTGSTEIKVNLKKATASLHEHSVTIEWELLDAEDTVGYSVYRSTNAEFTNPVLVASVDKYTYECPDPDIYQEGDVYFYRVYRLIGSQEVDPDSASRIVAAYYGERTKDLSTDPSSDTYVSVSMSGVDSGMPCTINYDGQPHAATCRTPDDYRGVIEYYYKKSGGDWTKNAPADIGEYEIKLIAGDYKDYNASSDDFTGLMELTNSSKWKFEIVSTDLSDATINLDSSEFTYNGSKQKPGVTSVKIGGRELSQGDDYNIEYDPADGGKNVGEYGITITPADGSSYTGSKSTSYNIAPCTVNVTAINKTITQGEEPVLEYYNDTPVDGETPAFSGALATTYDKDNPIAGSYNITQGTLALKTSGSFNKDNYTISFTGGTITVNATMHTVHFRGNHGDATPADQEESVEDGGTIAESSVTRPTRTGNWYFDGWYKDAACSAGKEWDFSTVINKDWDIYAKWTEKETLTSASFNYTAPIPRIFNRGAQGVTADNFTKPVDYDGTLTFSYAKVTGGTPGTYNANPIDAGVYQVKIDASAGSKHKAVTGLTDPSWRFTISKFTLTNANYISTSPTSYIYNGSEQPEPTVTVKHGSAALTKGSEFTLSYPDGRTALGKKRITVTGYGNNYDGSFTVTDAFEIGKKKLSDQDVTVTVAAGPHVYTGSAIEPGITVVYNGNTLSPVTDYSVSYSDNVNVSGTAKVTITARESSNYSDSKTVTFTISPRPLTSTGIVYSVSPTTYTYDGTEHKPAVTLKDNGTDLSAADDYTVTYLNNVNAGSNTAVAKVTGKGNYTGELQETFTINRATVNETNAEIIISNYEKYDDQNVGYFEYSGTPITPGITLKINGVTVTVKDTDFDRSDSNNGVSTQHKRQGTITLTGKAGGNYNGSVSKTYNIINKKIKAVFSSNGSPAGEKYVYYNEEYGELLSLTIVGYSFNGWYTLPEGGSPVYSTTTVTNTLDHVLYANWNANTYEVTLDANDGHFGSTGSDNKRKIRVKYGKTYGEGTLDPNDEPLQGVLPEPVRTGYDFDGWYADAATRIDAGTTVEIVNDAEFQAHWTAKQYTVTFDPNDAAATVTPATKQVTFGSTYGDLPTAVKTGYSCTGWYTDPVNETGTLVEDTTIVTTSAENQTLYAHWDADTYHVTLDVNGGDPVAAGGFNVTFDGYYTGLSTIGDPTRTGYEFTGWYDAKSGGNIITATYPKVSIARDHTLYAQWRAKKYQVTLDLNDNGSGKAHINPATNPIEVTYDQKYSNLPEPEWLYREYTFMGWFTAGGQEIKKTDICQTPGDHTLTAHWEFTISVNGISLDRKEAEIKTRTDITLTAKVKPENATDKKVIWESSDSSVARVDKDGRVTGLNPGEAVITASSHFDPSIKDTCKITVVPGNEEEVVDTEGNKVIIVRDPETNDYTTQIDGLSVLVISRADGSAPDIARYLFTSKRIKPGHKGYVLFQGVLYKTGRHCKIRYRKNKNAGTATAKVIWKKISAPRKKGIKRSKRDFMILVRSVSACNVVKMKKMPGCRKIIKMWLECDGVKIKIRKKNFKAKYTKEYITIQFRNSLEGSATFKRSEFRRKRLMIFIDQTAVQNNGKNDQQNAQTA